MRPQSLRGAVQRAPCNGRRATGAKQRPPYEGFTARASLPIIAALDGG
jgi:hypothetical protein